MSWLRAATLAYRACQKSCRDLLGLRSLAFCTWQHSEFIVHATAVFQL
jgi:hypothetical protein